jgi:hypothetical protein
MAKKIYVVLYVPFMTPIGKTSLPRSKKNLKRKRPNYPRARVAQLVEQSIRNA